LANDQFRFQKKNESSRTRTLLISHLWCDARVGAVRAVCSRQAGNTRSQVSEVVACGRSGRAVHGCQPFVARYAGARLDDRQAGGQAGRQGELTGNQSWVAIVAEVLAAHRERLFVVHNVAEPEYPHPSTRCSEELKPFFRQACM
jgi:hypothetical protein